MHYEITDLRLFTAVAQTENLSRGAAQVFLSPSAASTRIKQLEQSLGAPLFVRSSRGMHLSAAGRSARVIVEDMLAGAARLEAVGQRNRPPRQERVRVLAGKGAMDTWIVPALGEFLPQHPELEVDLRHSSDQDTCAEVVSGRAEIGVVTHPWRAPDRALRCESLIEDDLVLLCAPEHPLQREERPRFREALRYEFITFPGDGGQEQGGLEQRAEQEDRPLLVRMRAPNAHTALELVAAGLGIALTHRSAGSALLASGRLRQVPLGERWAARQLFLMTRHSAQDQASVEQLRRVLLGRVPRVGKLLPSNRRELSHAVRGPGGSRVAVSGV